MTIQVEPEPSRYPVSKPQTKPIRFIYVYVQYTVLYDIVCMYIEISCNINFEKNV